MISRQKSALVVALEGVEAYRREMWDGRWVGHLSSDLTLDLQKLQSLSKAQDVPYSLRSPRTRRLRNGGPLGGTRRPSDR
jgi:hypothetical protein